MVGEVLGVDLNCSESASGSFGVRSVEQLSLHASASLPKTDLGRTFGRRRLMQKRAVSKRSKIYADPITELGG
jgi:hypothetical protein